MIRKFFSLILILSLSVPVAHAATDSKQERNFIVEGNKLYNQKRYAEAETMYKKALTVSPSSEPARFNLASALIRQAGSTDPNKGNTPIDDAIRLLTDLEQNAKLTNIAERAAYDLGNISFNNQQYQQAIEHYKNALRKNPDNDKARENLRLAQLKLKQQQQQQNKDKQDKNQQKQDQQNKDQQQQQQEQKQQNDQNKQDQDKKQPQQQDKKDNQQQQPQPKQGSGISDENAQKILKAMENEESATRKKVEAKKQKANNARRRQVSRPW